MCTKSISKTTLKILKILKLFCQKIWKLLAHELFKCFRNNWQNTYWSIITLKASRTLFESRCYTGELERFRLFWWTDAFTELKSHLFSKKFAFCLKTLTGKSVSCFVILLFLYARFFYLLVKNKGLNCVAISGEKC